MPWRDLSDPQDGQPWERSGLIDHPATSDDLVDLIFEFKAVLRQHQAGRISAVRVLMAASELYERRRAWWTGFLLPEFIREFTEQHFEHESREFQAWAVNRGCWRGPLPACVEAEIQKLYADQQAQLAAWRARPDLQRSAIANARWFFLGALDADLPYLLGTCSGRDDRPWEQVQMAMDAVLNSIVAMPPARHAFSLPERGQRLALADACERPLRELHLNTRALQRFRAEALVQLQAFVAGHEETKPLTR